MNRSFECTALLPALAGALLTGCTAGTANDIGGTDTASASDTPGQAVPLADPMRDERPALAGVQTSPFAATAAPEPGTAGPDRLGAEGDTLGSAGDPSVLSGGDGIEIVFTDEAFTGFWAPVDPVPAAPREVLRVAAVPGARWRVTSFLDRAEDAGDASGNCFERTTDGAYDLVDGALRSVADLNAVQVYEEYAVQDGFLVLRRHVAPGGPGRVAGTYARTLPGLAARDLPVCER